MGDRANRVFCRTVGWGTAAVMAAAGAMALWDQFAGG